MFLIQDELDDLDEELGKLQECKASFASLNLRGICCQF